MSLLKKSEKVRKKREKSQKKRGEKECHSYFRSPQKYECHSHIAPFDKKEWHSSITADFGSGAQKWCSKECRSLTHWSLSCIVWQYGLSNLHRRDKRINLLRLRIVILEEIILRVDKLSKIGRKFRKVEKKSSKLMLPHKKKWRWFLSLKI